MRRTSKLSPLPSRGNEAHALSRVAPMCYLSKAKKSTKVINASPASNMLWPQRAIDPSIIVS